ncbi:flagellar biosynthesis protein FlhF [Clostridium homopropionicum DSM 5847]|uniref:Flagellar biosynthesis protein FlhF n=1 Tax=Clostridium homopropionicum DSM 5847 TaxID=1121318 RepID=A0A0L6ZDX3_9CLOT|nr:flagellar biosynthesis protein FlhF [Clostridium homopropionicum]KOA20998.1 flagellar biosynthesis protein FlhF [Clostridium homopropionicum DSM 5847]SFF99896.1 flagellar biosynthesis protein FlhF [Clostridium homopropionicum]
MIIKKYIVNNMNEAMNRIRYELGADAVIISQRKIKKPGFKGIFMPKVIEVTAAVDRNKNEFENEMKSSIDAIKKVMEKKVPVKENKANIEVVKPKEEITSSESQILKQMQEMKEMISKLSEGNKDISNTKSELQIKLENNDIREELASKIVTKASLIEEDVSEEVKIKKIIEGMIKISDSEMKGIVVLAGPTGVGKTTTIAKLAGRLALVEKKKVGLITIDTYRIGAIEQLNTYADIMNIPFKTVFSVKDMENAIESMKDLDVILIDTTGRSSKNLMQIAELKSFIQKVSPDNIYLVISSTTKDKDIDSIVEGYKALNFNNVIITKLDETTTYGSILNILESAGKPLSFITIGQNVPEDFKKVTIDEVCKLILGEDFIC